MDKQEQGKVFDLLSKRKRDVTQGPSDKLDYFAVGTVDLDDSTRGSEEFIIIQREPGRGAEMIRYVDILSILCPLHQTLSMQCEQANFHFEGQYLDVMMHYIQNRKLQLAQQYIPIWHHPPGDDEPIIHSITRDPEVISDENLAEMKESGQL